MKMNYNEFRHKILNCRMCRDRFGFVPHPIVMGNEKSKIVQISQAPSQNVHKTLKPFDDASGRKLRNDWYHISDEVFYDENNFYITSISHCYPGRNKSGGDRLPPIMCARKWLCDELSFIDNKLYILIGAKSASFFFPKTGFDELVFNDQMIDGKKAFVLPHPSPLNRKWIKDHPLFLKERMPAIEMVIHDTLGLEK